MDRKLDAAGHLAQNVVALRRKRALSQAALAKLAGIPRSTINHIESGSGNPSLANLMKLATAFQLSLEELLARPRPRSKLLKSSEIPQVRRSQGQALIFKLLPDPVPGMEMDRMEIEPRGRMGGIPHLQGTKEYLACIQGQVSVQLAGERYDLDPGDVLAFPGDQAHSYQNRGDRKAICISVVVLAPLIL